MNIRKEDIRYIPFWDISLVFACPNGETEKHFEILKRSLDTGAEGYLILALSYCRKCGLIVYDPLEYPEDLEAFGSSDEIRKEAETLSKYIRRIFCKTFPVSSREVLREWLNETIEQQLGWVEKMQNASAQEQWEHLESLPGINGKLPLTEEGPEDAAWYEDLSQFITNP